MDTYLLEKDLNKPIDVIIFIDDINLQGGTEIMAINLMNALNSHGVRCSILSKSTYLGEASNILSLNKAIQQEYNQISQHFFNKVFRFKKHWQCLELVLSRIICQLHPKLFINFTYDLLPAIPLSKGCIMCGILHWSVNGYNDSIKKLIQRKSLLARIISMFLFNREGRYIKEQLHLLDRIIVLTQAGKQEVLSLNRCIKTEQIDVIPNFIPFDTFSKEVSTLTNRTIIYVGRLNSEKGCYRLLNIWERVWKQHPDYHLNIFGEGTEKRAMQTIVTERGIQNIQFCGFKKSLKEIYDKADILLCTSESEGFGLVLVEAMHFGVVPVSFDCPVSPRELIQDAGILVKNGDEFEFANAVNTLIDTPDKLRRLQQKSIKRATDFYISKIVTQWKKLIYQDIIL